jgi:hypothetical protein
VLPQSGTSCWYNQQSCTANIKISSTAAIALHFPTKNNAAVAIE